MGRFFTCSDACHEKFGEFKKVVDKETGIAYRVPTKFILERGLKYKDLKQFPEWKESDDK